ncbi:MAG: hypothetical protein EXR92_07220 [Gemmatimonadetes bacterium]|nr:hypothetical protein [Gemmatimonadota bacterium]
MKVVPLPPSLDYRSVEAIVSEIQVGGEPKILKGSSYPFRVLGIRCPPGLEPELTMRAGPR